MKHIIIYANCAGNILKNMFEKHPFTKNKYIIHYISNYENLHNTKISSTHSTLLQKCDIFIYQPFNNHYAETEYDISTIVKHLKSNVIKIKTSYYRFRGFWYDSDYNPYEKYNNYKFYTKNYYGIHNSFKGFNTSSRADVIRKIHNIQILEDKFLTFLNNEINKFQTLDNNSDVSMFSFFITNYKNKHLFHDPFHPTNLFFYEMFRQIIFKLDNYELILEDQDFINSLHNIEMTHYALPILPKIKQILELKFGDYIYVFYPPEYGMKLLYLNIYDYYYIRLSHNNFKSYLYFLSQKNKTLQTKHCEKILYSFVKNYYKR